MTTFKIHKIDSNTFEVFGREVTRERLVKACDSINWSRPHVESYLDSLHDGGLWIATPGTSEELKLRKSLAVRHNKPSGF